MEDIAQDARVKDLDADIAIQDCSNCNRQKRDGVASGLEFVGQIRDSYSEVRVE
jgi:hypothetical protein